MKNLFLLFLPCLVIMGCTPPVASSSDASSNIGAAIPKGNQQVKLYRTSGKVMYTGSYCGGAAPSQEMRDAAGKARPMPSYRVAVRKGDVNQQALPIFQSAETDAQGNYAFELPPGEWCVIIGEKVAPLKIPSSTENNKVNEACIKQWAVTCDAKALVKDKPTTVDDIVLRKKCFVGFQPCTQYTGPMPPSPPPMER